MCTMLALGQCAWKEDSSPTAQLITNHSHVTCFIRQTNCWPLLKYSCGDKIIQMSLAAVFRRDLKYKNLEKAILFFKRDKALPPALLLFCNWSRGEEGNWTDCCLSNPQHQDVMEKTEF